MIRWCLALWIWLALATESHGAQRWRWSNPKPHGATVFDQASFGSLLVQVGELGQVYVSDSLDEWMPRPTGVTNSLRSVLFFGGQVIVSASDGVILCTEADALSRFTKINLGTGDWLEGLAQGAGRLVAVGDNGAIYTSENATNWARLPNAGDWLTSVAYGAGKFVAVGYEGYVISSPDGLVWGNGARIGSVDLNKVVYLNDRFWILGNSGFVRTSVTGSSWSTVPVGTASDLFDAATDGTEIVVVGRSELRTSSAPFLLWTNKIGTVSPTPPAWTYYSAHFDGSEFLVTGRSGMIVEGFRTNAASPAVWMTNTESPRNWLWSMVNVDGIFAAGGEDGAIFTSVNGFHFQQEATPSSAQSEILEGIGGNTNLLLAVGTGGVVLYSPGGYTNITVTNGTQVTTQRVSLLGVSWTAVSPRPTANELQGVGVFGSLYIISGGQGTILTSPDGKVWTPRSSKVSQMLSSIAASDTRVIAVGDLGALTTSSDGINWSIASSGVTNWIYQARYLNGQFVAVGEAGLIITSPNGLNWIRRTSGTPVWLNAVTYGNGSYYAVGGGGTVLRSSNAIDWVIENPITTKSLYGVATDDRRVVAAGMEGSIIRSVPTAFPRSVDFLNIGREDSGLVFLLSGDLDQPFTLQRAVDFPAWSDGPDLEITDDSGVLIYFEALGRAARNFYRTTLLAP